MDLLIASAIYAKEGKVVKAAKALTAAVDAEDFEDTLTTLDYANEEGWDDAQPESGEEMPVLLEESDSDIDPMYNDRGNGRRDMDGQRTNVSGSEEDNAGPETIEEVGEQELSFALASLAERSKKARRKAGRGRRIERAAEEESLTALDDSEDLEAIDSDAIESSADDSLDLSSDSASDMSSDLSSDEEDTNATAEASIVKARKIARQERAKANLKALKASRK